MQSGLAKSDKWILEFKTKDPTKNPLMGWESSSDTYTELKLEFSSKELAINYAKKKKIDLDYLQSFTNSPFLVSISSTNDSKGLFLRDKDGFPLVIDHFSGELKRFSDKGVKPSLTKSYLNDEGTFKTVFSLLTEKYDP